MATDDEEVNFRQTQMLEHLASAGQWERLFEMGRPMLADDPENARTHYLLAIAAVELSDLDAAQHHIDAILHFEPEIAAHHRIQAVCFGRRNRHLLAKLAFEEALRLEPENGQTWSEFAWNCLQRGDHQSAREAMLKARSILPESIDLERLETAIASDSYNENRLTAWEEIEALETSLRLDPEDIGTMYQLGHVYLHDLCDGPRAEEWFQRALKIDPTDRDLQKGLMRAVRLRDPVLRVLNWPLHTCKKASRWFSDQFERERTRLVLLSPILFPLGILALAGISLWSVFLFLPGKLYEYLTVSEAMKTATGRGSVDASAIQRLPIAIRLSLCLLLGGAFVVGVFWFFTNPAARPYHDLLLGGGLMIAFIVGIWISAKRAES